MDATTTSFMLLIIERRCPAYPTRPHGDLADHVLTLHESKTISDRSLSAMQPQTTDVRALRTLSNAHSRNEQFHDQVHFDICAITSRASTCNRRAAETPRFSALEKPLPSRLRCFCLVSSSLCITCCMLFAFIVMPSQCHKNCQRCLGLADYCTLDVNAGDSSAAMEKVFRALSLTRMIARNVLVASGSW